MASFLNISDGIHYEDINRIINDIAEIDFTPDGMTPWYGIEPYQKYTFMTGVWLEPMPDTRAFYYDDHIIASLYRRDTTIYVVYQLNKSNIVKNLVRVCNKPKVPTIPYGMVSGDIKIMFNKKQTGG